MIKLIRLLLALVGLVIIVTFAVSNRSPVEVGLWPLPGVIDLPLYGVMMAGMFFGVVLGGLSVWLGSLRKRMAGNRARRAVLATEQAKLKQEMAEEKAAVAASRQKRSEIFQMTETGPGHLALAAPGKS